MKKNPRWGIFPSPTAVKTFLDAQQHTPFILFYSPGLIAQHLGKHAMDSLYEVADKAGPGVFVATEESRVRVAEDLRCNTLQGRCLIVDEVTLFAIQNFEQRFFQRTARLIEVPDDGDIGNVYVRDVNRRSYDENRRIIERGHWTVRRVTKAGTKNLTVGGDTFDKETGATKDDYSHQRAYFSRQAMEDEIFLTENRYATARLVEKADATLLRKVVALLGLQMPTKGHVCGDCAAQATWVRRTQFAGNHHFCDTHAKAEADFGKEDPSSFFWEPAS